MASAGRILSINPRFAIPGGEITIECSGFTVSYLSPCGVFLNGKECRLTAASSERILAIVPDEIEGGECELHLESEGERSNSVSLTVGTRLATDMHMVANPAIDPADNAIILTRSGSRGQQLPVTLFRLEPDGYLDEMPEPILNPTGIAFGPDGQMYVSNRAQGEIYIVKRSGSSAIFASGLGIATTIAFGKDGVMYVGDRSGSIYRVRDFADVETFAVVEASVAAHHIAFSPDGQLYLTAPGFASKDGIYRVDDEGFSDTFYRGLGRPQGLAFDTEGNLYVAACFHGRHGVVKLSPDAEEVEQIVAGNGIVGLCFDRQGNMIVATSDTVYSVACNIHGVLLG